ncbi:protein TOPAZ1 isoform X2 [Hoplias malabaricus]|uniref:protein TOPAZ1 isoform X2 n=1 Tax=Hoplias malabaricus TaxID=27720 RepID=UPI0034623759
MQPTNRIKLNRSVFKLQSASAQIRRRTVGDTHDSVIGATESALDQDQDPKHQDPQDLHQYDHQTLSEEGRELTGLPSETGNDMGITAPCDNTVSSRDAIHYRLRFAVRLADNKKPEPSTSSAQNAFNSIVSVKPHTNIGEPSEGASHRENIQHSTGTENWTRTGATDSDQVSGIALGHEGCLWTSDNDRTKETSGEGPVSFMSDSGEVRCGGEADHDDGAAPVPRVSPLLLHRVPAFCKFGSLQLSQFDHVLDHNSSAVGEDGCSSLLQENIVSESSEEDEHYPLSFTCQRTQAYMPRSSCARTYNSWPFPRHGPPAEMKSAVRTGPRWIISSDTQHGVNNVQTGLNLTPWKNVKANLYKLLKSKNAQHGHGQASSTKLSKLEQGREIPEDPGMEYPISPSKTTEKPTNRSHSNVEPTAEQICVFQNKPLQLDNAEKQNFEASANLNKVHPSKIEEASRIAGANCPEFPSSYLFTGPELSEDTELEHLPQKGPFQKSSSEASREHCPPAAFCDQNIFSGLLSTQCTIPDGRSDEKYVIPKLVSAPHIKAAEVNNPSRVTPLSGKTIEGSEKVADHCQNQRILQASSILLPPSQEIIPETSTKMGPFKVDSHTMTSEELSPSAGLKVRINPSRPRTPDPATVPPNRNKERSWKKRFKSNDDPSSSSSSSFGDNDQMSDCSSSDTSEDAGPENTGQQHEITEENQAWPSECSLGSEGHLDVLRAYEEDAIVLDVIQDDPELFGAVVMEMTESQTRKNGLVPGKAAEQLEKATVPQSRQRIVWNMELKGPSQSQRRAAQAEMGNPGGSSTVETAVKTQRSGTLSKIWTPLNSVLGSEQRVLDCNNNVDKRGTDLSSAGTARIPINAHNSACGTAALISTVPRTTPGSYCWYYFSEHHTCLRNLCWYLHLPRSDDEKFCMETVQKFCRAGNPVIVKRAVEVFVGFYSCNFPGGSYNTNTVNFLLLSLMKFSLLQELFSVISTLLTHSRPPPPELIVALYETARERGLLVSVPKLIFLTSKMIDAGCIFSVTQCENMQKQLQMLQVTRQQLDIFGAVKCRALVTNPHTAEMSVLAQAVLQVELCKQQENWSLLASVFCNVCVGQYDAGEVSRFCCYVTLALLKDTKDKHALPYEIFAESVCQEVASDGPVKTFLGRVGVSLMLKYYKLQDWAKGVKLIQVMTRLSVDFSKLSWFFEEHGGGSRCRRVSMATEMFLNSGSTEGALSILRADEWFVSSSEWPCEEGDVENRRNVLTFLAGRTSHRDTLEVLCNLPGLSQTLDGVDVCEYSAVFNAHLQKCVMNQVLPVAADTLEFMFKRNIRMDPSQLHIIIHKLGKQNLWNRARALFKRALAAGCYSEVTCENDCLSLPCALNEIEMTLAYEMFITRVRDHLQNLSSSPLVITLSRSSEAEIVYLAAGSRVLSSAQIPNPKLNVRYVSVDQNQQQLFHLDPVSATKWLSHNHSWAQEMWDS